MRYLYSPAGAVIGHVDKTQKYLYDRAGEVVAYFDPSCKNLYRPDEFKLGYAMGALKSLDEKGELVRLTRWRERKIAW